MDLDPLPIHNFRQDPRPNSEIPREAVVYVLLLKESNSNPERRFKFRSSHDSRVQECSDASLDHWTQALIIQRTLRSAYHYQFLVGEQTVIVITQEKITQD